MEKLLLFIKHNLSAIWAIIEWGNSVLFTMIYSTTLERILPKVFKEFRHDTYTFRRLIPDDSEQLYELIKEQPVDDLEFFHPHAFDLRSIKKQFNVRAFLMMGVFEGSSMIGYFFLRFFANRKCFVGRLIDKNHRGRGIGDVMNKIMYNIAWRMNFRCLSTISRNNKLVMHSHSRNSHIKVIKELQADYLLVEFVR
ncbi:MAG TPA: hypothetical protein PL069_05275 [Saprospiraceae bacterium]|jgi:hypothetical protein|nr:MAG: hypothetical protein BWX96_02430 [Bacteroidetes bacterium ADurb.Bin145]HQP76798.1 hypothetical protein [Saprospiraceae bacterium]